MVFPTQDDMYCNGPSCLSFPIDKVQKAGYKPLVNDGGSTTSEDTLKNTTTTGGQPVCNKSNSAVTATTLSSAGEVVPGSKLGTAPVVEIVETTSQRKTRPKFVRQKSFEIDSDSTDTSLADISNIVSEVRIEFFKVLK